MSYFLDKFNISLDNLVVHSVKMIIVPYSKLQNPGDTGLIIAVFVPSS